MLGRQGYLGMTVPPQYGGAGASYLTQTLVTEALAYGCPATAVVYEVHNALHVEPVFKYGTEAQRQAWIPRLLTGAWLGAFALTEPEAGSEAHGLKTVAQPVAGGYRLSGAKVFVTSGGEADRYLVFARLPGTTGRDGITAFVVDRNAEGLRFGPPLAKMGLHASVTRAMHLDGVFVPTGDRLGDEGMGYTIALDALDGGRIGIAAQAVGLLAQALAKTLAYARTRRQFGRPIGDHQLVRARIADMIVDLRAARLLTYEAARRRDRPDVRSWAASAKLFASERAVRHALNAVQTFGGYGYIRDYGVERLVRDAKVTEIYEGTSDILRLIVAGHAMRSEPDRAVSDGEDR